MAGDFENIVFPVRARTKKFRRGTPKSRNGCLTCKIRRIKCDETKPWCLKCTLTGRKCDGYDDRWKDIQVRSQRPSTPAVSFRNPLLDFFGTPTEHRFLKFFNYHTAPIISGCFDSDFWSELIPQVGQSEPTIQHAMIAVAALHARLESVYTLLDKVDKEEELRQFELLQYNKAIRHLRMHLSGHGVTLKVTLMCCVLLISLEFLRGDIERAILHLQGGMSILENHHTNSGNSQDVPASEDHIARKLNEIFYRLRGQWLLCGRMTPSLNDAESISVPLMVDKPFSSMDEARSWLDRLMEATFQFIHFTIKSHYTPSFTKIGRDIEKFLSATHTPLCTQLGMWSENFETFIAQHGPLTDGKFFNSSTILRMLYIISSIWLSACIMPEESAFDAKIPEFSSLVILASSLTSPPNVDMDSLESNPKPSSKRTCSFTFDMGAIAPLYFTATACRDRKIRRDAISLLGSCLPRREGLWDADIMQYVARRVVEIEEVGLNEFVAASSNPALAKETFLPPEHDRVVDVTIHHRQDSQNTGRKLFSVTYMMKSTFGDEWLFRQEDVALQSDLTCRRTRESTFTKSLESGTDLAATAFQVQ